MDSHNLSSILSAFDPSSVLEPPSLQALRRESQRQLQAACEKPFPAIQQIASALSQSLLPQESPGFDFDSSYRIVCANGFWPRKNLSYPGLFIFPLSSLKDPYTSALHASWQRFAAADDDPVSLLARASYQDALFIAVPPDASGEQLLHIHYCLEPSSAVRWAMPRLHLSIGKNSSLHLIETSSSPGFLNSHMTVDIERGGTVVHTRLDIAPSPAICSSLYATVQAGGSFTSFIGTAAPFSRHAESIFLVGEGASATIRGLSALSRSWQSHRRLLVDHQAPKTFSSILFKGIVLDGGLGAFEGTSAIRRQAQKSESHQHSHFLTLGKSAKIFNKPRFDIFADDVVATHGATSGRMDEELLFYLNSRGVDPQEGRRLLIEGFCEEMIRSLPAVALPYFFRSILEITKGER
jgi:Fe-S cluster assembly protein SufD